MKQIEKELMELLKAYGGDRKQALKVLTLELSPVCIARK